MNRNLWSDFISTSGLSLELILQYSQCDCHPRFYLDLSEENYCNLLLFKCTFWVRYSFPENFPIGFTGENPVAKSKSLSIEIVMPFSTENKGRVHVVIEAILLVVLPCQIYISVICFSIISHVPNHGVFLYLSAPQSSGRFS